MAVVFDTPRPTSFRRFSRTAHCASTLRGKEGTQELLAFGRSIGLEERWLQCPGTAKEHFDLFDGRIEAARQEGATQVTREQFIAQVVQSKRSAA